MRLELDYIAASLESLEETIIQKFIDRAQFMRNQTVYRKGENGFTDGGDYSLLELRMRYHEDMDALFGRFLTPEERPFTANGRKHPARKVTTEHRGLRIEDYNRVNLTKDVWDSYIALIPEICEEGDDGNYGSSVEHDVAALQAISRRIHFGAFYVAESKFLSSPDKYTELIKEGNRDKLLSALTREEIEKQILKRIETKVETIQAMVNTKVRKVIPSRVIMNYYKNTIIPVTKTGEIKYLLMREI
ncbi:MAG: chorismate mutase [Chitinivibrionales bacterium]